MNIQVLIRLLLLLPAVLLVGHVSYGQDAVWTLDRCIRYAQVHNLKIEEKMLDERRTKMQLELSKWAVLPNVSLSSSYGRSYGRSVNPTTNQFETRSYGFAGLNGSANVLVFGWFQKRNTIRKNEFLKEAAHQDMRQLQSDISLNVATAYLRCLLAKDQVRIALDKLGLSTTQVERTEQLLAAGRSNGQDMAQVRAQLQNDSTGYYKAGLDYELSLIDLKTILNISFEEPFSLAPFSNELSLDNLSMEPAVVYGLAEQQSGKARASRISEKATAMALKVTKAGLLPQISVGGFSGSNYSSSYLQYLPNGEAQLMPWGRQLWNNLSYSFSVGLTIPIFSGLTARYTVKQAAIDLRTVEVQGREVRAQLKNEVYKACLDARAALQALNAARSTADFANTAYAFARQRYEKGLIPAIDLLVAQNDASNTAAELAAKKYDLMFKLLLIDHYLGRNNW